MTKVAEHYDIKQELGKGAFSIVKKGINKKTNEEVAIKIIDKKTATTAQDAKRLDTEVAILKKVHHPNIICLKDLYEDSSELCLVMELVTGGELFDKIVEKGQYTENEASIIVKKMLSAVEYLHAQGIAHRDLKPENLLLKSTSDTEVMISDFGLSKIVSQQSIMDTACGTPYYVAPEVLLSTGYDKEVDLWSVGVITYLLLCGFPPFYGESLPEVFEQIMKADYDFPDPYWTDISADAKDLIKKLLVVDAKKRLSASEALKHPWVVKGGSSRSLNVTALLKEHTIERKESLAKMKALKK